MTQQFGRMSILSACDVLAQALDTHSQYESLALEWDIEDEINSGGLAGKNNQLKKIAANNTGKTVDTIDGTICLQEAIVRHAIGLQRPGHERSTWKKLKLFLARDGFNVKEIVDEFDDTTRFELQRMHPEIADIPTANDEVHELLKEYNFDIPLGHLEQAIDAHTRAQWASANSQIRTFIDGLLDEVAERIVPEKITGENKGHGRRAILANLDEPFLSKSLFEWSDDGKHAFIPGLFKRLNPEGSHPGLSDEEDSTFRLHIVLITARLILRRYKNTKRKTAA